MAAIKSEKNKALAALTTAALSLPGLHAVAAIPAANVKTNISYGHYEESSNRMKVDVYHADAVLPINDRIELAFSLDRDTYSGATPAFSMPTTLTNLPKYEYGTGKLITADLVSAASGGVTASGLTSLGGLNSFVEYETLIHEYTQQRNDFYTSGISATNAALKTDVIDLSNSLAQNRIDRTDEYIIDLGSINTNLPDLFVNKRQAEITYQADYITQLAGFNSSEPNSIKAPTIVDFGYKPDRFTPDTVLTEGAYYGKANTTPNADGTCVADCVYQNGMVVGTIEDPTGPNAHLHQGGSTADRKLAYHNDSGGIYIRAQDLSAFSLNSIELNAPINGENPYNDPQYDYYEILGFSTALNPGLATSNGTDFATKVAYQTVLNGTSGTVILNNAFKNISAAWIHYAGAPNVGAANFPFKVQIDNISVSPTPNWNTWSQGADAYKQAVTDQYNADIAALNTQYQLDRAALGLSPSEQTQLASTDASWEADIKALDNKYKTDLAALNQDYQSTVAELDQFKKDAAKQSIIATYRSMIDSMVPSGTPTVQRFQWQPMETRSMPQFTARYYFDATTLGITGGLSDEPDFLSNFGSANISHEFNDKLTTVSAGYGVTSNTITRNGGSHTSHHANDPAHNPTNYPDLNEDSLFHSFNTSIAQVLGKNTLFQSTINYANQSGYLSNPYKFVYVRGEVTAEEYYEMSLANTPGQLDWNSITNLEMVGVELFREVRPGQRNLVSFSNQINQHIPELNASAHFDYRFYTDDWGINSHTFELKWYQSLPWGLTVTPNIRYYSQSQADFFAPYFLAPRADGNYSSDFRLSAFGDLTGGITITKDFARGISLETGIEYTTHSGNLKLGGGGVGDYADFDYFIAHANLSIDLSAKPFAMGGGAGDHDMHHHHHHGAPIPAGVMFGHMMNQADDIMIGYRYQYGVQRGSMRSGNNQVSDALLVTNACAGNPNGCLYKPTTMHMNMHMLDLMYAPTDWLNLMLMPQLMSMDMNMSQPLRAFQGNEEEDYGHHAGTEHTSNDLGDTVVTALVKVMDDGKHHVHAGIGMSAPTGAIDAELTPPILTSSSGTATNPNSAVVQDYGMQLGSGTWDFKPSLTYTGQMNDWGWGGQLSGVKRLDKNKYGYAYGDMFQATGWGSYNIFNWLSATVRGVYTWQDKIHGQTTQNHENISPVDFPSNYGGRYWDVGLGLNASIPEGQFAGHNISVEWLQPVNSDFNGYQLDRDGALTATWSYSF